jgi:hypothetical protein
MMASEAITAKGLCEATVRFRLLSREGDIILIEWAFTDSRGRVLSPEPIQRRRMYLKIGSSLNIPDLYYPAKLTLDLPEPVPEPNPEPEPVPVGRAGWWRSWAW